MKKVRVTFLAVAEDEIENEESLYPAEKQVENLNEVLKKGLIGSKALDVSVRYASRQILDGDEAERVETLVRERPSGLFECFHCLHRSVVWQCDYMFEDFGYEGDGIVQVLTCANCGAEIEYRVPFGDPDEEGENPGDGTGTDKAEH